MDMMGLALTIGVIVVVTVILGFMATHGNNKKHYG